MAIKGVKLGGPSYRETCAQNAKKHEETAFLA